jgi:HEPN domain-containing protein
MIDMILVKQWFEFAYNDLIIAKHLFEDFYPKQIAISCFHSQQSAEKALKGYLIYKEFDPPKIHELAGLCRLCIPFDETFKNIFPFCAGLSPYGVASRYPNEIYIDDVLTKIAITRAQTIYDFCLGKIPELNDDGNEVIATEEK